MLFLIAWRNIWRSRIRSLVVISAIALGLWSGIFLMSFSWGMNDQRARDMIETQLSHIQIHTPAFLDDPKPEYTLDDGEAWVEKLRRHDSIQAISGRTIVSGMLSTANGAAGITALGVFPSQEAQLTALDQKLVEGAYFEGIRTHPILIGQKLAEKYKLDVRKKVVLTFQRADGEMTSAAFRIAGLYKSINSRYEEAHVFVQAVDLQQLIGEAGAIHEIGILLTDPSAVDAVKSQLMVANPSWKVEDWKELAPDLRLIAESFQATMAIFMGIIMLALAFGIINTMLMAVLERTRELGMLMSIGMNKFRVFGMIMAETLFLSLIGGPLGILLAYLTVSYFGVAGIDLAAFTEGLSSLGMSSQIYPHLEGKYYGQVIFMVIGTALLSSLYPAWKALQLHPAEAVRSI